MGGAREMGEEDRGLRKRGFVKRKQGELYGGGGGGCWVGGCAEEAVLGEEHEGEQNEGGCEEQTLGGLLGIYTERIPCTDVTLGPGEDMPFLARRNVKDWCHAPKCCCAQI